MKILIVEDNPLSLNRIRGLVQEAQPAASLFAFSDSADAMDFICTDRNSPSVAFLDIEMPKPNGLQLADALLERNPRVNVIIVTGHMQYQEAAFRRFVSGYLVKPVRAEDIRAQLAHLRYPPSPENP